MSLVQLKKYRLVISKTCILLFDVFNRCFLVQKKKEIGKYVKECQTFTIKKN